MLTFWIGVAVFCVFIEVLYWLLFWKPKQETPLAHVRQMQTETYPEPEPQEMDFQAFFVLLLRYGNYGRTQAQRLYYLSMYKTVGKDEAPVYDEDACDDYDAEIEAELIIEEIMEKGA